MYILHLLYNIHNRIDASCIVNDAAPQPNSYEFEELVNAAFNPPNLMQQNVSADIGGMQSQQISHPLKEQQNRSMTSSNQQATMPGDINTENYSK